MISEECKNCDCLDESNEHYPCKLDSPLRCNILKSYHKKEEFRRLVKND